MTKITNPLHYCPMLKDKNDNLNVTLGSAPNPSDLQHFMQRAENYRTKQLNYSWHLPNSTSIFKLTLSFSLRSKIPTWQLVSLDGNNEKLFWRYDSSDLMLVYNLIVSATEELTKTLQADGMLNIPTSYSNLINNRLVGYTAITSDQMESNETSKTLELNNQSTSSIAHIPTTQFNATKANSDMTGNLATYPLANLLQSLNMAKITGKLIIESNIGDSFIFFDNGQLIQAVNNQNSPIDSLFLMLSLKQGLYYFVKEAINIPKTITASLDSILMQCITLIDQFEFFEKQNFNLNQIILKKNPNLTEKQFEAIVQTGVCPNLDLQKAIYINCNGQNNLNSIINLTNTSRKDWIPAIYNLIKCDLICSNDNLLVTKNNLELTPKNIDKNLIFAIKNKLATNSALLSYAGFLFFLDREINLSKRYKQSFSVILMNLKYLDDENISKLTLPPKQIVDSITNYISQTKRSTDILANYELFDFAILLPFTSSFGTNCFCQRLIKNCYKPEILGNFSADKLFIALGLVTCPDDYSDIGLILSAAQKALQNSIQTKTNITQIRSLFE